MKAFNEHSFEQKLFQLKDAHDCISSLSNWCLSHQQHSQKIISTWLNVLKKMNTDQRLLMFYLANDIIQYSKRKNLPFVDGFAPALQKGTTMVRDESIRNKILRLFKIWDDRNIYDETFLVDLSKLLTDGYKTTRKTDVEDFQAPILYSRLKSCKALENDTEFKLRVLNQNDIPMHDIDKLRNTLKDRKASEDVVSDIDEGITKMKGYVDALEAEIKERKGLIDLLDVGEQFYEKEYGDAKVVLNAYKCFTVRVKGLKRKLDTKTEELAAKEKETQENNNREEEASSQSVPANFYGAGSFMNNTANFSNYFSNQQVQNQATTESVGTKYSPDSTVDVESRLNQALQKPYVPVEPPVSAIPKPVQPPATTPTIAAEKTADPPKPYSSLDERLEYQNFVGHPSFLNSSVNNLKLSSLDSQGIIKSEAFDAEVSSSNKQFNTSKITAQDLNETASDLFNTSTSLVIDWKSSPEPDLETPESPPSFEKFGFSDSCQDMDIRVKDIDHRNLINLTAGQQPEPAEAWSPNSNYVGELSPVSVEDNVENIDMDLSDEDDKKSCPHKNNEENSSCDICSEEKNGNRDDLGNLNEGDSSSNLIQPNSKGYYTSTVSETNVDPKPQYQTNSNNLMGDIDLRQGNPSSYFSPNVSGLENINYFLPPPPPPPPLPSVKEDSYQANLTSPLPPPPPPSMSPITHYTSNMIPPPPPPISLDTSEYNKTPSGSRFPTPRPYYNSYSPILSSDFRPPTPTLSTLNDTNRTPPVYSTNPANLRYQNPGYSTGPNNPRLQNPSGQLQAPLFMNQRNFNLLNNY